MDGDTEGKQVRGKYRGWIASILLVLSVVGFVVSAVGSFIIESEALEGLGQLSFHTFWFAVALFLLPIIAVRAVRAPKWSTRVECPIVLACAATVCACVVAMLVLPTLVGSAVYEKDYSDPIWTTLKWTGVATMIGLLMESRGTNR